MKLFSTKSKDKPTPAADEKEPVATVSYTNGGALASEGMAWVVRGMLIIAFLAALIVLWGIFKPASKPIATAAQETVSMEQPVLTQSAGSYAVGFVGAWLSSTKSDADVLQGYIQTAPASLGARATDYRNLAVASVSTIPGTGDVRVIISGEVLERATADKDPGWVLRYYSVTVATTGDALVVTGFPALVSGPDRSTKTTSSFKYTLNATEPATQTASLFLAAYLTGQGSTTPYLSPGVDIAPISPVPYKTLTVSGAKGTAEPAPTPADGDTVRVEVVATLQADVDQSVTSTYQMLLTARAGRWEVASLESAAPAAQVMPSPTTTPTPSTSPIPIHSSTTTPSPSDG